MLRNVTGIAVEQVKHDETYRRSGIDSIVPDSKGRLDMKALPDLTKGFWGTAFADIDKEEIYLTQKYYAFGQFSKYIRPGMTIIHTNNTFSLAAYDKDKQKIVLVAVNSDSQDKTIRVDTKDFNYKFNTVKTIRTSGSSDNGEKWHKLPDIETSTSSINLCLRKNSITTFIFE